MANIRVTPETLRTQGNDLVGYAEDLRDILAAIHTKINEITDGWDGLSQDAYYEMYASMKESLDQFPELVNALGGATSASAGAFESIDEELRNSFQSAQ